MARLVLFVLLMGMLSSLATVPAFAQATSSVQCRAGIVIVSMKEGTVITCGKNEENQAGGGCDFDGNASCDNAVGIGSCTIVSREVYPPTPRRGSISISPGRINDAP